MNYIRFLISIDLKKRFKMACDKRPMTAVLIQLINKYIAEWEEKN
jgi:hypothetical protein